MGCWALRNVTIPNSVTSIGDSAFYSCSSLTNVIIGNSVVTIGDYAFSSCTNLTGVYFRGNAPTPGSDMFYDSPNAIVYSLPGPTGWGPTFGDRPTALWQPQMLTSEVRTNQFGFNIAWSSGMNIAVDACTSLASPDWLPLQTITLAADTFYFTDPDWTNSPRRFYRVRWP